MKYDLSQFKDKKVIIEIRGNEDLLQACRDQICPEVLKYTKPEYISYLSFHSCSFKSWDSNTRISFEDAIEIHGYQDYVKVPLSFWDEPKPMENPYNFNQYSIEVNYLTNYTSESKYLKDALEEKEGTLSFQRDFIKGLNRENEDLSVKLKEYESALSYLRIHKNNSIELDIKRVEKINAQKEQLKVLDKVIYERNEKISEQHKTLDSLIKNVIELELELESKDKEISSLKLEANVKINFLKESLINSLNS